MPYKDPEKQREARRKYEEKRKEKNGERKKFWLFLFYPESAPENWQEIISSWQTEVLISPLHDQDKQEDGTLKKPHYHGVIFFDSMVTKDHVSNILKPLNGPQPIRPSGSKRSACRYLIHADDPNKAQYERDEILTFGGADYDLYTVRDDDNEIFIMEMIEWIDKYECYSYKTLMQYAMRNRPEWFRALCRSVTYVIKEYLKSSYQEAIAEEAYSRYSLEEIETMEFGDPETGEVPDR